MAALFRLEHSREPEDVRRVVERLVEWLAAPEQTSLRRAFTVWLRRVLLPARLPGVVMPEVTELQEVRSMLAERVIEWTKEWKQQGLEEGRREGLQQGQLAAARESVLAALELRFGRPPIELEDAINRIEDLTKLRVLLRRAILASSLDEFTAELDAADTHAQDPS